MFLRIMLSAFQFSVFPNRVLRCRKIFLHRGHSELISTVARMKTSKAECALINDNMWNIKMHNELKDRNNHFSGSLIKSIIS
jgi:hypothetical protein